MNLDYLKTFGLPYLASPYSKFPRGLEMAFIEVSRITARLATEGLAVFSPIVYTHPLAQHGKIDPMDHEFWLPYDQDFMDLCGSLLIAKMETWEHSFGIAQETGRFRVMGKPIFYLDPETLMVTQ